MNNKDLAIMIKSYTRTGSYEYQLEVIEKILNKERTEQLHKHDVSDSVCDHTYISMEEPMIVKFTHQCSKCGKTKAN